MNTTGQLKAESVRELMSAPGPCITLAVTGNDVRHMAIDLKEAVGLIETELQNRGVDPEELLAPVSAAIAEARVEPRSRGIVILRSPSIMQVHRVPEVTPVARVDDRFDLRTVLALEESRKTVYILALSQNRARILKCTQDSSEEIPFPAGFSNSLADAMQTRKPDHVLDNRASGGPSMGAGAVMFGTSSDRETKNEYLLHYFSQLDKAVHAAISGSTDPLIAAGVETELALYRTVNTYPHLVEPGIAGAPDGLEGGEMHRRALELLEQRAAEPGIEVPADFDKRVGTGHASTHIQEIVMAAFEGRVSHLFFQASAKYVGTYDPVRRRVSHTNDPLDSPVDLVEMAAYQTIMQSGEAKIVPGSAMPNGVPVCALFRYPLPRSKQEAEPVEITT